jgi:hypothetical protein
MSLDLDRIVSTLSQLLARRQPATVNSSWIRHHAPACYRFIRKGIRTETGEIDWDRVTSALYPAYQKRWRPRRRRKLASYANMHEVNLVLKPLPGQTLCLCCCSRRERQTDERQD